MSNLRDARCEECGEPGCFRYDLCDYCISSLVLYDDEDGGTWCDECNGQGFVECLCGGDICVCKNQGEMYCPNCGGTGDA